MVFTKCVCCCWVENSRAPENPDAFAGSSKYIQQVAIRQLQMNVHTVWNRSFVAAEKPQLSRLDAIVSIPQRRTRARCVVPRYQRSRARESKQSTWRRATSTTSSGTSTASAFATFCSVVGGSAFVHDYRIFADSESEFKPVYDRSVEDATKRSAIWHKC